MTTTLSISNKQRFTKVQRLALVSLIASFIGIAEMFGAYFYFNEKLPSIDKQDNNYIRIYIERGVDVPEEFKFKNLLTKFPNVTGSDKNEADLIITSVNPKLIESSTEVPIHTDILVSKYLVPITKFGTSKRILTIEELGEVSNYSEEVAPKDLYRSHHSFTCEEAKKYVNENEGQYVFVSVDCVDESVAVLGIDGISIFGRIGDGYKLVRDESYLDEYVGKYEEYVSYSSDSLEVREVMTYLKSLYSEDSVETFETNQIVMTGVTAMGRGVSWKIKEYGPLYPSEKVKDIISEADIAHTSNEVSFYDPCIQESHTLSFCAPMNSLETLTSIGIDVVELTGNHNNDRGSAANYESMVMYEDAGIMYIGGGKNIEDANSVTYSQLGEYKIGWVGMNSPGPAYAWATETTAGAAEYSDELLIANVKEANENADIVIVVIQWTNENYDYPTEFQKYSAHLAIDIGADIVVGSQGHGTQKMEFYGDGSIYYALGNFIFDQMFSDKVRRGFVLRANTIDGEVRNLEFLPYVIENYAQPNFVEGDVAEAIVEGVIEW